MRSDSKFLKLVILLSLIGILVSGKLLSIHNRFTSGQASLTESCTIGGGHGCIDVAVSDYSVVLGIVPLAAVAMGYYFTLLLLGIWALRSYQSANEPLYVSFFLATAAVVVTVVMFVISNYVLQQFCQWCAMLWVVNLAVWPCLVKQLGLGWGDALGANAELLGGGRVNLRKDRIVQSFSVGLVCLGLFSILGVVSKKAESGENPTTESRLVDDYGKAPIVMLPPESVGGALSKGFTGEAGAPIMEIVEFADFQCPACRAAAQALKPFLLKHGKKVRLSFHNFPLDGSCNPFVPNGSHTVACATAKASLCAGRQNKFWEFHDLAFDRQQELSPSTLEEIVSQAGLEKEAFQACLKDPATEAQLQKDMQMGDLIALQSTPTVVINNRKLVGAHPPAELESLLYFLEKEARK